MLGEFFAAREDDVDETLVAEGPFERFETIEAKTISSVSIATLGEIVGAGTYDELFDRADEEARQSEDGESGIDAVLPELQLALGRAEDLDSVARERLLCAVVDARDGVDPASLTEDYVGLAQYLAEAIGRGEIPFEAATDELADWLRPDDVADVVRELSELARRAQEEGRRLWFWWSL